MSNSFSPNFNHVLPEKHFDQLGSLLQTTADLASEMVVTVTEDILQSPEGGSGFQSDRFFLVISEPFSALLQGTAVSMQARTHSANFQIDLTFSPKAIAAFLTRLIHRLQSSRIPCGNLQRLIQRLQPNDTNLQDEFTLRLIALCETNFADSTFRPPPQALYDALTAAQAASRAKSDFLATVSHELRTPLTYIIGMSSTLLRWPLGQLSEKQQEYLQKIYDSGEQLLGLINDTLDLAQMEAGKISLDVSEFSLSNFAHQVIETLRPQAQQQGVELLLSLQVSPRQNCFTADQRRVQQILVNLLSNAIKFTPKGGQVTLRIWDEGTVTTFQVEDTGIGIPEHLQPLIFERFQQLETSHLRRQYSGAGLGLALTKQLVELHQGWIDVQSAVGMGSVFTVRLPNPSVKPVPSHNKSTTVLPTQRKLQGNIVLIENDEETAFLICSLLTTAGYQVVWMVEGLTAMQQVEILQPLLVITAIQLPGMNGCDLMRALRNTPAAQSIKILVLLSTAEDWSACQAAGADDYLPKPIQPEQLLTKTVQLTAVHPPVSPSGES